MMQVNLFISNFRKKISSVFFAILFLGVVALCNKILTYILVDDTDSYTRLTLHELYNQEENIDILFLGTSHCYRSLDTSITDEIFGTNTFNCGSSGQELDGSYALLIEAGKKHDLKKVYLEMYYDTYGYNNDERTLMTSTYIVSDYMKPSLNRFLYLINASTPDYWIHGFFPARRNWNKLFESRYVCDLINSKGADSYQNYKYGENMDATEYYAGKGYVASNQVIQNGNFSHNKPFGLAMRELSSDNMNGLRKIIEYCDKNDIELICFSSPMPDFRTCGAGDYDSYIQYISGLLAQFNIPYYDFNLCRENYFSYDSDLFMDDEHLNRVGAEKFSGIFSKFFCDEIAEKDFFYSSYKEKLYSIDDHFYGVIYNITSEEDTKNISFEAIQNKIFDYYASVFKKADGMNDFEEVQILQPLASISIPVNETGCLFVYIFDNEVGGGDD